MAAAVSTIGDPRVRKLSPSEIQALLDASKTPRVRELEYLQSVYDGTQYVGRPNFFDDSVPMQERAPCIVYRLTSVAIESNVAFAMGENRFPVVLSLSSENDQAFDPALGLNPNESQVVDSFNSKLIDLARLEQVFRNAYRMAQASRSVAIVLGFRNGLPFADLIWSKLCTPYFEQPNDPFCCTRLEIRYRYTQKWRDQFVTGGEWWTRVYEYLRVIDGVADTVFQPVPVWDPTDAGATYNSPIQFAVAHGFGFCPVHWYARNRESLVGTTPDGKAIHDGHATVLEQLDLALSQRHRAAVYAGDPQTVLSGVAGDEVVGATGRAQRTSSPLPEDSTPRAQQWKRALYGGGNDSGGRLRRGVGEVWRISDPSGKATLLCLPGDALKALDDDAKDLANKACDGLGVTMVDPSAFSGGGDLSGRTLSFIFSKQINRVSQDREDVGRCCILPVINLYYRMLLARPTGVYLPGLAKVLPVLQRFYMSIDGNSAPIWFAPQLKLKWGDYFEPSDVDEATRTATAISAYTANIISIKSAVEHIRTVFAIGSVDQYVKQLAVEVAQRQQDAIAQAQAMAPAGKPPAGPSGGNAAAGKSANASAPASGNPKAKRNKPS